MAILAIQDPSFQPAYRIVTAITNGFPALVTTSFDHQYFTGTIVRLYVPIDYGMVQANHLEGSITVTSTTQFTIDIDTTNFDLFAVPASPTQYAQVVPIGEENDILVAATQNIRAGAVN